MIETTGNTDSTCKPANDMATTLSASVELPAPHAPRCACCASLDDALMVIASLQTQLAAAQAKAHGSDACWYGCTEQTHQPRCPIHGVDLRHADNPEG